MAQQLSSIEFTKKFDALSEIEQTILRISALFLAPLSKTTVIQVLKNLDVRIVPTRQISHNDLTPILSELIKKKMLLEDMNGLRSIPAMREYLLKTLIDKQAVFKQFADAVLPAIANFNNYGGHYYYRSYEHCLQHIRLAIYQQNEKLVHQILYASYKYHAFDFQNRPPFTVIFREPLDKDFLLTLPPNLFVTVLEELCNESIADLKSSASFETLELFVKKQENLPETVQHFYLYFLLLRGRIRELENRLQGEDESHFLDLRGMLAFIKGDDDYAIARFDKEIARIKKQTGKRKIFLPGYTGIFHLLALIRSGLPNHIATAIELSTFGLKQDASCNKTAIWYLNQLAIFKTGVSRNMNEFANEINREYLLTPFPQIIQSLSALWLNKASIKPHFTKLYDIQKNAESTGYLWIAAEAAMLIKKIDPDGKHPLGALEKLYEEEGVVALAGSNDNGKDWERSLKALISLAANSTTKGNTNQAATRLVWLISGDSNQHIAIQPIEQKQKGRGWSNGRNIALKRLIDSNANTDFMTAQDRKIAACIKKNFSYYSNSYYDFDIDKALNALIGHPLVFNEKTEEQMTVARGEFTLKVDRKGKNLKLLLDPLPPANENSFYIWEGTARLLVYETGKEQQNIAAILGDGLTVPLEGEKKIGEAISAITPFVTVHSDVLTENSVAETVDADSRLHIVMRPFASGIILELLVRPLGEKGPAFHPGRGGGNVIASIDKKSVQTARVIKREKELLQALLDECSTLDLYPTEDNFWRIGNPEGSLELLEELHELTIKDSDQFVIEWPEGEKLKLRGTASWNGMKASLKSGKEWFSVEGTVSISENEVMTLQQLLELSADKGGRFIQLADGEFLALTDELRRRLDDLSRILDKHGKENRFHPLSASLVEEALNGAGGISGDKLWKSTLERFKSAQKLEPKLPATFQATLREYQLEGYEWLSRLAHWGVGACLADDMGLGKTIQALGVLVARAEQGASLVLAPTSVCLNWESECQRFAPTLNPRTFGSGNRKDFIDSLQPFDLVICSYTLFQQEAELLTGYKWNCAILDEAQAIKNMATKRSQAAMQIQADFRIATTGTPVENRLDELWNLFRFLNPGLLGSHKSFTERFGTPIERDGDKNARNLLKKLIRPFMLRRTKSQVLQELPPRTDILQRVELSKDEMALYEALRRKAVENLQGGDGQGEGERQIRILAEIMRLRRACCNPELVMPKSGIGSSKMAAFREIVDELRENGHRALVFSQFVDHLSLIRASLDADKIKYQYLDGSTPQKTRQESVTAFQRGEGELFLISLKAGGVGLNLTAADYVIHLDPWWNPAVEDQASDRAHRIGQLRPVTVYRLVAANTIEEKIVALHHQKRDLADSLLEGTDTAARVSADDLMDLLREAQ